MTLHIASLWLLAALRPEPRPAFRDHLRRDIGLNEAGRPRAFGG